MIRKNRHRPIIPPITIPTPRPAASDQNIYVSERVPGWKMYPDIATTNGKADVDVKDIVPLGFNLITMHYTEYGAMWGMMYYGMENFKNENTVFSDVHAMGGLTMKDRLDQLAMDYREWLRLEKACYEGKEDEKK